jgi:hypothetical protein
MVRSSFLFIDNITIRFMVEILCDEPSYIRIVKNTTIIIILKILENRPSILSFNYLLVIPCLCQILDPSMTTIKH